MIYGILEDLPKQSCPTKHKDSVDLGIQQIEWSFHNFPPKVKNHARDKFA